MEAGGNVVIVAPAAPQKTTPPEGGAEGVCRQRESVRMGSLPVAESVI